MLLIPPILPSLTRVTKKSRDMVVLNNHDFSGARSLTLPSVKQQLSVQSRPRAHSHTQLVPGAGGSKASPLEPLCPQEIIPSVAGGEGKLSHLCTSGVGSICVSLDPANAVCIVMEQVLVGDIWGGVLGKSGRYPATPRLNFQSLPCSQEGGSCSPVQTHLGGTGHRPPLGQEGAVLHGTAPGRLWSQLGVWGALTSSDWTQECHGAHCGAGTAPSSSKSPPSPPPAGQGRSLSGPVLPGHGRPGCTHAPTPAPPLLSWPLFLLLFPFIRNGPWPSPPPASAHLVQAPSVRSPRRGGFLPAA